MLNMHFGRILLCNSNPDADRYTNAFYIQSLATVFQNGRQLGSHKERRDWSQYCL